MENLIITDQHFVQLWTLVAAEDMEPVNVEGFAIGSIQNQGFYDAFDDVDIGFTSNNAGWQMTVNASYDTSKITLKWYVNGSEDTSKQNQTSVTFNRPSNNEVQIYTAKAIDLTGTIIASDDVLDNTDFYEGLFQSYFIWCADYDQAEGLAMTSELNQIHRNIVILIMVIWMGH